MPPEFRKHKIWLIDPMKSQQLDAQRHRSRRIRLITQFSSIGNWVNFEWIQKVTLFMITHLFTPNHNGMEATFRLNRASIEMCLPFLFSFPLFCSWAHCVCVYVVFYRIHLNWNSENSKLIEEHRKMVSEYHESASVQAID